MTWIADVAALEAIYPEPPVQTSLDKVAPRLTPLYRRWIMASRFCILTTVGPEGTDASPRGDDGPVVAELDPQTLALPDWRGNNRIDSLRNIVRDGRVSLMFLVRGSKNVVRVNGRARLTADPAMTGRFEQRGRHPRAVIVVGIAEVYFQCAKAVMRADLWSGTDDSGAVPTAGEMIREADAGFDAEGYDAGYPDHAKARMW
ncbi:pyridoxamine 5'-phosphate oxidase family protein [Psychromarinibacter sp. C21-152]|uniref:Pyridoxamine 5'-phosphate oxidase family protein n=1 Tax=Psychromarinibacter sediminicola TaxID=3033385 RepID=A0AAE3TB86_9RHOB|nr:pyridoxamine 5'-phosphate oxidase family protein [Psychromarinibacter sediminicola]MDF0603578.1 pyridoxamine 5'-phosphate oxidase family protein [Psychromarinibacter sediminicola]